MPGTLVAIIIVVLFIRSALEAKKSPFPKALIGFLSFFVPALLWTYFITPGLRDTLAHDPSNTILRLTANYAYVLVASMVSLWTWFQVFGKADD
jgi:branched-subunit amino acid transport protein